MDQPAFAEFFAVQKKLCLTGLSKFDFAPKNGQHYYSYWRSHKAVKPIAPFVKERRKLIMLQEQASVRWWVLALASRMDPL